MELEGYIVSAGGVEVWTTSKRRKEMTSEPDKTSIEPPQPSARKSIIALTPRWKKPAETEKKTSPSRAN
jgi:hypothetical protein